MTPLTLQTYGIRSCELVALALGMRDRCFILMLLCIQLFQLACKGSKFILEVCNFGAEVRDLRAAKGSICIVCNMIK